MPDAARISDFHVCPKVEPGPVPHVGGPIFTGSSNVIIGFLPAAREGDRVVCFPVGPADQIKKGSTTVLINHRQAARRTDPGSHISGDLIAAGCPTVVIGDNPQSFTFRAAARRGTPFCEECERKRREMEERGAFAEPGPPDPDTASLDDDEPPPGARAGRDAFADVDQSQQELAAAPDVPDGLSEVRQAARFSVAYQFYAANLGEKIKPSQLLAHIKGIDLSKPVEVRSVAGVTLHQHSIPGARLGQYFTADPAVLPEDLGCSPRAYGIVGGLPSPPPVARQLRKVTFGDPAFALQSTATTIVDDWSYKKKNHDPDLVVYCRGGGSQLMIPPKFHPSVY